MMASNPEPADPIQRQELDLPPKSYAEAVEQDDDYDEDGDTLIDEDAIKESPPRTNHRRDASNPRTMGEVIDEATDHSGALPNSPTLRHVKGRLEEKISKESYADAVKDGLDGANGKGFRSGKHMYMYINTDTANGNYEGIGEYHPGTPTLRRSHKRVSSKDLNGSSPKSDDNSSPLISPKSLGIEPAVNGNDGDGEVIYENVYNKSGENLASLRPGEGYYLSLAQP
jgi:2-acylglycerol O-acyltransferase 2